MEKKLHFELRFLQAKYPQAEIEVWAMDEHRLGLLPVLRRVWTLVGEQRAWRGQTSIQVAVGL